MPNLDNKKLTKPNNKIMIHAPWNLISSFLWLKVVWLGLKAASDPTPHSLDYVITHKLEKWSSVQWDHSQHRTFKTFCYSN